MSKFNITSTVILNNGVKMPIFGLGTFQSRSSDVINAVKYALTEGYIHIDTAEVYRNEKQIGATLKELGITRDKIFITSKLAPASHGYEGALRACHQSLSDLQVDYIDLYLVHWPGQAGKKRHSPVHKEIRKQTWKALEELYASGKCKAIGVSNYTLDHLTQMAEYWKVKPAVNQVECHPRLTQLPLRKWCKDHSIVFEAYSSLGVGKLLKEPQVVAIAERHGRTTAQVLLRWGLQHELVVIPKSVKAERISENAKIFD
eukprot:TRINITY_DN5053_c0_g1_i1.p1 TRINITY_DN5053_c0_g1~~TRINITY_DN5053_c0_g1_i1.p1  ORF type:complete len:259 (+),score=47.80 TRINITY_DN5053_c0_g1_i1:84-860(+)